MTAKNKEMPIQHRLTKQQVALAMELLNEGVTFGNVALELDVHHSTLARYIRGAEMYGYSFWSRYPTIN